VEHLPLWKARLRGGLGAYLTEPCYFRHNKNWSMVQSAKWPEVAESYSRTLATYQCSTAHSQTGKLATAATSSGDTGHMLNVDWHRAGALSCLSHGLSRCELVKCSCGTGIEASPWLQFFKWPLFADPYLFLILGFQLTFHFPRYPIEIRLSVICVCSCGVSPSLCLLCSL
jgi:hypothetical protein